VEKKNDFFHRNTFADKKLNILDSLSSLLQARHVYHDRTRDEKTKSCVSLGYMAYAYMKTINFYKSITPKDISQLTQFVGIVDDITKAISTLDSYSETLESGLIQKQISDLKEACMKEYQKMILNITSCLTKKSKYVSRKIDSIITDSVEAAIASYGANITFEALMNNKWNTQSPIIEYLNKNDDGLEMFVNYLGSLAKNSKMKESKKKMVIQCNHDYMMSLLRSDESVKNDSDLLAVILKKDIAELFPYIL
jgi:DNA integrity scanning protein DisA with diadenylate cyclase activity